jgi:hypothetical protein
LPRRLEAYLLATDLVASLAVERPGLERIPRPVVEIADALGLTYDPTVLWRTAETQGVLIGSRILCSGGLSVPQTRFCIAHEIGHHFLGTTQHVSELTARDEEAEGEADAFAAGLLMPHKEVGATLRSLLQSADPRPVVDWAREEDRIRVITRVANGYRVGHHVVLQTLVDMGLVTDFPPWQTPGPVLCSYRKALKSIGGPPCRSSTCRAVCSAHFTQGVL